MKNISEAELEVMNVIWQKEEITSPEIIKALHWKKWNHNTIRTLINRLLAKGAIEIVKKEKRICIYKAILQKQEYNLIAFKKLLKTLYHNSITEFVEEFYKNSFLSKDELEKIQKQINEMLKKNDEKHHNNN